MRLAGDKTPDGYVRAEIYTNGNQIVVLGAPAHDDTSHNCDAMRCGQDHVLLRDTEVTAATLFMCLRNWRVDGGGR